MLMRPPRTRPGRSLPALLSGVRLVGLLPPCHLLRPDGFRRSPGGAGCAGATHPSTPADRAVIMFDYVSEVFRADRSQMAGPSTALRWRILPVDKRRTGPSRVWTVAFSAGAGAEPMTADIVHPLPDFFNIKYNRAATRRDLRGV